MAQKSTHPRRSRDAIIKIRTAISRAVDDVQHPSRTGEDGKPLIGVAALSVLIAEALALDPVGTLKALAPLLPKDVMLSDGKGKSADQYSDEELGELVAEAAARAQQERDELGALLQ